MPVFATPKGTDYAWASFNRLAIVGTFFTPGAERRELVTWEPGDPVLLRMDYERHTGPFLVLD